MTTSATIDRAGRILVPLKLRRELGMTGGAAVVLSVEDGELRIRTKKAAIERARERLKKLKKPGRGVVEEFLAGRRGEARREVKGMGR